MNLNYVEKTGKLGALAVCVLPICLLLAKTAACETDPWSHLQGKYQKEDQNSSSINETPKTTSSPDPWSQLQAIYLPFTEQDEILALKDVKKSGKVSDHLHKALKPFAAIIKKASQIFNIPAEIIGAVIMVESGGNPNAKAKTSTASGLMQTIRSTFKDARQGILNLGIMIKDTPFDPEASIMTGSWYLNRMFERAKADGKFGVDSRGDLDSWHTPAEYYYAGPGNGKKNAKKVIIYSGGRRIVVDKSAYSQKVMRWAHIMGQL